jgi:hypothetical protein
MRRGSVLSATLICLLLAACSSMRESEPERTATEQLLFSTAAERAADKLAFNIPLGTKVFVDASYVEGVDSKYLISALRDRILRRGGELVASRDAADIVIEPRVGAISLDRKKTLFGIPDYGIPIPLAGEVNTPEIALFKRDKRQGVIKVAATNYNAKTGKLIESLEPVYGFSHRTEWAALVLFNWESNDLVPEPENDNWVGK